MSIDSQLDFAGLVQAPIMVRVLFCLALLIAVQVVGYWWYLEGKLLTLEQLRQQERTLKTSIISQTKELSRLPALTRQVSQLKRLERKSHQQLLQTHQSSQILQAVDQFAKQHQLSLTHMDWGARHQQIDFDILPLNIELSGYYHDIARFTQKLTHLPQLIHVTEMEFERSRDTSQTVKVTLRAQLYQTVSELSAARHQRGAR